MGWKDDNGGLYKGDNPAAPAIGDIRVHYTALTSGSTVSVLAQQAHGGFAVFVTPNGYSIRLARAGNAAAAAVIFYLLWRWHHGRTRSRLAAQPA